MYRAGTSLALREAIIDRYGASSGSGDKLSSESLAPAGQSGNRELKGQPKSLSYKEVVELGGIGVVSGLSAGFFGVGGTTASEIFKHTENVFP